MTILAKYALRVAPRAGFQLRAVFVSFFLLMLLFVLGNAAIVYSLLSRYDGSLGQAAALDSMRTTSQQLAVQAMRLSDGAYIQTGYLSIGINTMERALQALERGGVLNGREVAALAYPEVRDHLPRIRRDWGALHARLQAITLSSYIQDDVPSETLSLPASIQRQWLADDAASLLASIDASNAVLVPLLHQAKGRAQLQSALLVLVDLLMLLFVYLLLRFYLFQPLRELNLACLELEQGRYSAQVQVRGRGEMRRVAQAFNAGVRQVQDSLERMHKDQADLKRSDTIFQGLALNSIVGIFLADQDHFSFVSNKMAEIFAYEPREMVETQSLLSIIVPRERYLMAEAIKASRQRRDGTMHFERRGRKKDGSVIDIEVFSTTITEGEQISIIGLVQDVTERKKAESSAKLSAIAYENSGEAIAITDVTGVIIDVNPAYSRMTGYWHDEVAGELLPLLSPGRHNREFYDEMWHAINVRGRWEGECWSKRKSGEDYAQRVVLDTAWNHDGSVSCRVAMLSDITEKKKAETDIWNQAHHDPLTALPNRQYFNESLQKAVYDAGEAGQSLGLLFLDLDLFKEINDSMGHATGDRMLVEVAQRLRTFAESRGFFVARLGGDEFVIILNDVAKRAHLDSICQSILDLITEPYTLGEDILRISASLGVALYPQDAQDAETLLRHVDMAMYVAKGVGRDCYHYFDQSMRDRARMQHDLLYALSEAIDTDQFFLLFQPIYSMRTGRIIKAEVLLRWQHPEFGVIAPMEFIPFAEEHRLMRPLEAWIFHESLHQLAYWRQCLDPNMCLAINVSPGQIGNDTTQIDSLLKLLDTLQLPPQCLTLEFNEQILVGMDSQEHENLRQLHQAGIRLSVEVESFSIPALLSAQHLPFDTLKIDRKVTALVLGQHQDGMVLDTLVSLAHRLGMRVVAEGVTGREQYELLCQIGCDAGQGFWLDGPLQKADFEQRLQDLHSCK